MPEADFAAAGAFFDFPYPSDARLTAGGTPDVAGFPDPGVPILAGLKLGALQRRGFPVVPVGYFRVTAKLAPREWTTVITGGVSAPVLLIDVDPSSPDRGNVVPVVAHTHGMDPYVPEHLLAIAARPGVVLHGNRKYAFVVRKNVGLEGGGDLAPPAMLASLARGEMPAGSKGAVLRDLHAPLWETLDKVGVPRADVVGAAVFTTGDVVADNHDIGSKVLGAHAPVIEGFELETATSGAASPLCHVRAKIALPQFQKGTPPFDTEGLFELGPDGAPIKQRDEVIPISIGLPKTAMPPGGYPLVAYFHGSGGVSRQVIDGGPQGSEPNEQFDHWPGPVLTKRGFAVAGAALPISPERVKDASDFAYVNVNNLVATRDTFRQGILEARMFLGALEKVRIPPAVVAACAGLPALPSGEAAYRFAPDVHAQGQSMGAMYTNLVSATDPRIKLAVPTGAGGYWSFFILQTTTIPNASGLLALVLLTTEKLTFLHPAIHMAETALEAIDPMVSAARVGRDPLPGHPVRSIYVPAGKSDSYFPESVLDAMAVAYAHPRVGDAIWPTMDSALSLVGVTTPAVYPVQVNTTSANGTPFTSAVVQYAPEPGQDGHAIYRKLEPVRAQYACFHSTFRATGTAIVVAPGATCP
jgi:hypothetical protein